MDRGEKHPFSEGNLGDLLLSFWFRGLLSLKQLQTAIYCHQFLLLCYIICVYVWALSFPLQVVLWLLVLYCDGMSLVLTVFSLSKVELGNGRPRNTLCDCVSSTSQISGQGSLLLAERKQESEWKRHAQSWGCFFSYSQSTSSSSCCNPAIKIVFHSAFSLYITKATTDFFSLSLPLTCWQFSLTKKLHRDR